MTRDESIALIIKLEGGLADNPHDPGGRTNMGITQHYLDAARAKDMSLPQTVDALTVPQVTGLYQKDQWAAVQGDLIPPGLALLAFNAAVNAGPGTAIRMLQAAVGVNPDGVMGSATRAAINGQNWRKLGSEYAARLGQHYASLDAREDMFELGWMRRLFTVYTAAVLASNPPESTP